MIRGGGMGIVRQFILFCFITILFRATAIFAGIENYGGVVPCPELGLNGVNSGRCIDVGCRPSIGECANSCADHRWISRVDTEMCGDYMPHRCYCRVGDSATSHDEMSP
jgi:hypothetical protein